MPVAAPKQPDVALGHAWLLPTSRFLCCCLAADSSAAGADIGEFAKMGGGEGLFSGGDADSGSGFLSEDLGAAAATLLNL